MNTNAADDVRAALGCISAAWQERRYDDLAQFFAEDMVFALPGLSGRLEGREAIVESYREFMDRITLTFYKEDSPAVEVWGDAAIAVFRWEMKWLAGGVANHETGHDVFAFRRSDGAWKASWRTMMINEPPPR
jgi:uncharacterized protein (TIGR02246 family)